MIEVKFDDDNIKDKDESDVLILIDPMATVTVIDIFRALTEQPALTIDDLYELGCYLKTFAEVHKP